MDQYIKPAYNVNFICRDIPVQKLTHDFRQRNIRKFMKIHSSLKISFQSQIKLTFEWSFTWYYKNRVWCSFYMYRWIDIWFWFKSHEWMNIRFYAVNMNLSRCQYESNPSIRIDLHCKYSWKSSRDPSTDRLTFRTLRILFHQ